MQNRPWGSLVVLAGCVALAAWGGPAPKLNLRDVRFPPGADLRRVRLPGCNMQAAQLSWSMMADANLRGANLQGAQLANVDLTRADLRGADLRGADLRSSSLSSADLRGAQLDGARLEGTNFYAAKLNDARFDGAEFDERTSWPDGVAPPHESRFIPEERLDRS